MGCIFLQAMGYLFVIYSSSLLVVSPVISAKDRESITLFILWMFNFKPSSELSACLSSHRLGWGMLINAVGLENSLITLCLWGVWSPNTSLQKHRLIFPPCDVLWEDKSEQLLMSVKSLSKACFAQHMKSATTSDIYFGARFNTYQCSSSTC